jgi:uncharacterized protein DUF1206
VTRGLSGRSLSRYGRNTLERLARFGYGARGVVYCVVGALAVLAAIGQGGRPGDSKGALRAVLGGPFGAWIVGFIAIGLFGFALWRLVEGVTDADNRGTGLKGYVVRAAQWAAPRSTEASRSRPRASPSGSAGIAAATTACRTGPPGCWPSPSGSGSSA